MHSKDEQKGKNCDFTQQVLYAQSSQMPVPMGQSFFISEVEWSKVLCKQHSEMDALNGCFFPEQLYNNS